MPNILVVEDDAMIREVLVRRLHWEGHQVVTASNGAQAVAMTRAEHIDLVLMDMGLPILNGWQATQRIRAHADTRALPIIALTAYALSEERARCFEVGCDDYEPKPFDFERLLTKMHTLLERSVARAMQTGDRT
jgi:CheY-like chemotaxis protein